jgi:MarR family transcriptional regulator, organic hydroperoxide resistance regulator
VPGESRTEQLNAEIQECVFELTGRIIGQAERLAQRIGMPAIFIKALAMLDAPMAMKDLGKRMHCDPSFVTAVADMLEKRGLARREAHPGDRRVKNLILTGDGCDLKRRVETELSARMPWSRGLNDDERAQLLALIRKMLSADAPAGESGPGDVVAAPDSLASAPVSQPTTPAGSTSPPAPAGEVDSQLGVTPAAR